jgi:pimeloyl-ACP methyl ester carboxylesterase
MDGTGQLFYRQVPLLARSYTVVTYALRDRAGTMDALIDDLANIIDRVAPDRQAIIIGESFGGALALSFALARPEQVSGLVILNSFPYFAPQWRLHLAAMALGGLPWGTMQIVRRLTAFRLHSRYTHRADIRRFMELTAQTTREGYVNRLKLLARYDVRDRLRELRVPTLFLAADCDHLVPSVPQAEYMAARTPRSAIRVLEGHGHICLIAPDIDLHHVLKEWLPSGG